ncbi:MAG: GNAT family N-acetyltransferase [Bacteroidota bacterium]
MKVFKETDRILLREIVMDDKWAMFEMDSDPLVHRYLWKPTLLMGETEATIKMIRKQYEELGIGRWAIIDKETNAFAGWGGLKLITSPVNNHNNFYDVGYRLLRKYWGMGYATESAKASVAYAFEELGISSVYAMAHPENEASRNALQKTGLVITDKCEYQGLQCDWFELKKEHWVNVGQ